MGAAAFSASASGTINLHGDEYMVDTLFHNQVGPGSTQTSLWLHNDKYSLRVFYATMDMTNPYLSLRGVCATDKLAGNERIARMATRKSQPGQRYFLGINGDFFETSGTTARGVSRVGSPVGTTVCDGDIYRTRYNATLYKNFIVDADGSLYIDPFRFSGTLTAPDGSQASLAAINTEAANNQVTIYNYLYYGSTCVNDGWEVVVEPEGGTFPTYGSFNLVVKGTPSNAGDMVIPAKGFVMTGRGSAASWVQNLKEGDVIAATTTWKCGDVEVHPVQVVSGNPKIAGNGQTLDTETDRNGDAQSKQPRTGIGFSDDGKKVYFCVVDGRSLLSTGCRTMVLADIMRYAGATEAMNLDGGGSSMLYTMGLGIRNVPSDGYERSDGNGFYCVSTAPDDDVIASIRFQDFSLSAAKYSVYTPHFFGYNQYGMLIDTDVKGVVLSCPEELGHIRNDSIFFADGEGTHLLTATLGDVSVSMPMTVGGAIEDVTMVHKNLLTDALRDYAIEVNTVLDGKVVPMAANALTWTSSDPTVVTVDPNLGILRGKSNGTATVIGQVGEVADTMYVTVERPTAHIMPADGNLDPSTWALSLRGGKDDVITPLPDGGFRWQYVGQTGRLPRHQMTKDYHLWSLPDTVRVRFNPYNAEIKNVVIGLAIGNNRITYQTVHAQNSPDGNGMYAEVPIESYIERDEMRNEEIKMHSIEIYLKSTTTGVEYTMDILGLDCIYDRINDDFYITGDINGDGIVDVSDVNLAIDMVLGKGEFSVRADFNDDGIVDVSDVNQIIDIVLGKAFM